MEKGARMVAKDSRQICALAILIAHNVSHIMSVRQKIFAISSEICYTLTKALFQPGMAISAAYLSNIKSFHYIKEIHAFILSIHYHQ